MPWLHAIWQWQILLVWDPQTWLFWRRITHPQNFLLVQSNQNTPIFTGYETNITSTIIMYLYTSQTLGNDVSSSAAVATYLGFLLENQDKSSFGKGVFSIDKCYNCSYNAFRKMDLRVEIIVPEPARKHNGFGIDAYAVDAVGNRHEVDELFWKETHVCAMLRLIEGPPVALRPIKVSDCTFSLYYRISNIIMQD